MDKEEVTEEQKAEVRAAMDDAAETAISDESAIIEGELEGMEEFDRDVIKDRLMHEAESAIDRVVDEATGR
jgi:hypothetical protein